MDFGFGHPFGATKLAIDGDNDTIYVASEYARKGRERADTRFSVARMERMLYRGEKLNLLHEYAQFSETHGQNERQVSRVSVEAGLFAMLNRMLTGRWRCLNLHWLARRVPQLPPR